MLAESKEMRNGQWKEKIRNANYSHVIHHGKENLNNYVYLYFLFSLLCMSLSI